jgi:hypothetical protein
MDDAMQPVPTPADAYLHQFVETDGGRSSLASPPTFPEGK